MTVAGARKMLGIWATARLTDDQATFSAVPTPEQLDRLAGLFDAFHGAKDRTYRMAALHVASGRCLTD